VAGINPPYEHEDDIYQQVGSDCIWSDPASEEQEQNSVDPETGFGESLRGGGAICFGNKAITEFLQQQGFSYIMRAHEAHSEGVAVSKGARVFTVFSTSKDHNQGSQALAGCILVDGEKLQVINRSPAYKNQYVHRRDSMSLMTLSTTEIAKRVKLGLVTDADDESSEDEEWDDFESSEEEEEAGVEDPRYTFAKNRRSSINLLQMNENYHDSSTTFGDGASQRSESGRGGMFSSGDMDSVATGSGSCRNLEGIAKETIKEQSDDDEASTVNGEDSA
jgi:hypothetical protein